MEELTLEEALAVFGEAPELEEVEPQPLTAEEAAQVYEVQ